MCVCVHLLPLSIRYVHLHNDMFKHTSHTCISQLTFLKPALCPSIRRSVDPSSLLLFLVTFGRCEVESPCQQKVGMLYECMHLTTEVLVVVFFLGAVFSLPQHCGCHHELLRWSAPPPNPYVPAPVPVPTVLSWDWSYCLLG